jgi:hypothetical protein
MLTSGKGGSMKRKRYTDEQIAYALRQAETGTYRITVWHLLVRLVW